MRLEIEISLDDDAIQTNLDGELRRLFNQILDQANNANHGHQHDIVDLHNAIGRLQDFNGNVVGGWWVKHGLNDVDDTGLCRKCNHRVKYGLPDSSIHVLDNQG